MSVLETLGGTRWRGGRRAAIRRLAPADLAFLGIHVCSALHYLHGQGFLHLDLKPWNMIADRKARPVLDLSIARPPGRGRQGVGTQCLHGTGAGPRRDVLTPATDVWGIGTVLYEAAAGTPPFPDGLETSLNRNSAPSVSPSVRSHRRLPAQLARAIDSCLDPEPSNRPGVGDVSNALDAVAGGGEGAT